MQVRPRGPGDRAAVAALAQASFDSDGYPKYHPGDFGAFMYGPDAIEGWVAVDGDRVVGHAALHRRTLAPLMALAAEQLGVAEADLGVVARVLVAPEARRGGVGRHLLDAAAHGALARGLLPVLDVGTMLDAAVALYERAGWRLLGQRTVDLGYDRHIEERVYAFPLDPRH